MTTQSSSSSLGTPSDPRSEESWNEDAAMMEEDRRLVSEMSSPQIRFLLGTSHNDSSTDDGSGGKGFVWSDTSSDDAHSKALNTDDSGSEHSFDSSSSRYQPFLDSPASTSSESETSDDSLFGGSSDVSRDNYAISETESEAESSLDRSTQAAYYCPSQPESSDEENDDEANIWTEAESDEEEDLDRPRWARCRCGYVGYGYAPTHGERYDD